MIKNYDLSHFIIMVLFVNCCRKTRYHQLNQTPRKYSSFWFFFSLLFVIAILNFISPCDGRGGNLFTILYGKLTGTYNGTYAPLTEPFSYQIENLQMQGDEHVILTIFVSSISKISCTINETHLSSSDVYYPEGKETRFYIRTQTLTTVSFHVQYLPGVEQSLFCKISGLLYEPYHIEYYKSDPFNVTYSDIQIQSFQKTKEIFYFSYLPKSINWVHEPIQKEDKMILCQYNPLMMNNEMEDVDEKNAVFVSHSELPMYVFGSLGNLNGQKIYCGWLKKKDRKWQVVHVDELPIH